MVFESIVVDVLNRLLGNYFENLDTSQLKLGIWGGDVVLRELLVKHSAMDEWGLPFKVVIGKVGTLRMKIPWQNLYSAPVELNLENLVLLLTPSSSVKYNHEAEEKDLQAAKEKELVRLDEIRAKERLKNQKEDKTSKEDTFTEKLIAQIIKNVQIHIDSIHLRYEDDVTKPNSPFACGIVLRSLYLQTTDENWSPAIITAAVETVNKMATLEGLSLYWNSKTTLLQKAEQRSQIIDDLQRLVISTDLTHILGPISSTIKVLLTPNPDRCVEAFSKPKFFVDFVIEELALALTNLQFQDIMQLVESLDYLTRAQKHRKYRPADVVGHKGHYKEWWIFAYTCIVEEEVRRKRQNWDWNHMKRHRALCRSYADAYYKKLTSKKVSAELQNQVSLCEKELDVFNLTLVRKQVEVKVEREGTQNIPQQSSGGWFSGWFGGGESSKPSPTSGSIDQIAVKFEEALTPQEKAKLYSAIDYSENALPLDYPKAYEEYVLNFKLNKLSITVSDVIIKQRQILSLSIANVEASIKTRPVGQGMTVALSLESIFAIGMKRKKEVDNTSLITSKTVDSNVKLLSVEFDNNPLNSSVNQRIVVRAHPIEIVYDAKTVIHLTKCFTLPPELQLNKLQAAAMSTLVEWREQSTAGLQHLIETRGEIDVDVDMLAPYIMIPSKGKLTSDCSVLIIDLGDLKVRSKPRNKNLLAIRKDLEKKPHLTEAQFMDNMGKVAFDIMNIELRDFQVLMALPGEQYSSKRPQSQTTDKLKPFTLLKSQRLVMQLHQSLIPDDPRFAKLLIEGNLPSLDLDLSEHRLLELLKLVSTLPLPGSDSEIDDVPSSTLKPIAEDPSVSQSFAITNITYRNPLKKEEDHVIVEFIELILKFSVDSIHIRVIRPIRNVPHIYAEFMMHQLQTKFLSKSFSNTLNLAIGGLTLSVHQHKLRGEPPGPLYILKTPMSMGILKHLFKLQVFTILPSCPIHLATKVKQEVKAEITSFDVVLHFEALKSFMEFADQLSTAVNESASDPENDDTLSIRSSSSKTSRSLLDVPGPRRISSQLETTRKALAKKHTNPNDVLLQVDAYLESLTVQLSYESRNLVIATLREMRFSMQQFSSKTEMVMELKDLGVKDLNPNTVYADMVKVDSDKVLAINVIMYDNATSAGNYFDMNKHDMSVKIETGSPYIYYIASRLSDILEFLDNFQNAKEAIMDASTKAALTARENVEQVYASSSRILLNVKLSAPIIFIPRNDHNPNGFIADLGILTVNNSFVLHEVPQTTESAIVEKMEINLHDMKVSRAYFNTKTQTVQSEILLLDPISLRLSVNRNLSSDTYHGIPELSLSGTLWKAYIRASNEDYDTLMYALAENILLEPETQGNTQVPRQTSSKTQTKSKKNKHQEGKPKSSTSLKTILPTRSSIKEEYVTMDVDLELPQLRVIMYQKGSARLEECHGIVKREEKNAFADFSIANVKLRNLSKNNGNMDCRVVVSEIILKDVRPGKTTLRNLIQKKEADDQDVAILTYKADAARKRGQTMSLNTTSITVVLCLDYLLQILDFFTRSEEDTATPAVQPRKTLDSASDIHLHKIREGVSNESGEAKEVAEPEPFSGFYNFSETEIILVESMDSAHHSNAFLLHCEVSLRQQDLAGRSNLMGTVGNIKLSTCKYSDEKYEPIAEVISPMSITLVWNTSQTIGTLMDVNISDIFIRMTAGTLELLLKVVSTLGGTGDTSLSKAEAQNYSDIWDVKKNNDMNFWFLKPDASLEVGMEALLVQEDKVRLFNVAEELKVTERLVLESGCIVFTFETGVGSNTTPMLLIESSLDLQMFDWSSNMTVTGRMKLEAAYFNPTFGLWEYIIEPVETRQHGRIGHRPWELFFEYSSRVNPTANLSLEEGIPNSQVSIALQSHEIMELTVTKTALEVFEILKDDFNAATKKLVSQKAVSTAAYTIENDTGYDIKIIIKDKISGNPPHFLLRRNGIEYEDVILHPGTSVNLSLIESSDMTKHHTSVLREQEGKDERMLAIEIPHFKFRKNIPVNRASKRYYEFQSSAKFSFIGLLCDICVKDCSKIVTLRSVVQIINNLPVIVSVMLYDDQREQAEQIGEVLGGEKFNLPISSLYSSSSNLFFKAEGFGITTEPYSWKESYAASHIKRLQCRPKSVGSSSSFYVKVIREVKHAFHESTNRKSLSCSCYYIRLEPPLIICNMLPVTLAYSSSNSESEQFSAVLRGNSKCVTDIDVGNFGECSLVLKIPDYNGATWSCSVSITKDTKKISKWELESSSSPEAVLTVGVHKVVENDEVTFHVYMPYWMINRTGLDVTYKGDDKHFPQVVHKKDISEPLMFAFPGKAFFSKKAAFIKVKRYCESASGTAEISSDWSPRFSLDVAGSDGSVICKSPDQNFEIGVEIQLSSWGLTKYVIFSPRYYLVNQCAFKVAVKEVENKNVVIVQPNSCLPFWPLNTVSRLVAIIEVDAKQYETKEFTYDTVRHTLLQLNNRYGGIHVDIHFSESKTVITFSEFIPGQAPALIINATEDCPIEISEEGLDSSNFILLPKMNQLFTWKVPYGERVFHWTPVISDGKHVESDRLLGDGFNKFHCGGKDYYWISFLDGLQRILLFTPDIELVNFLQASRENEMPLADYIIMLNGIGVSLVDNEKLVELMYLRISSSEIMWEVSKSAEKMRFKPLTVNDSRALELAYQNYQNLKAIGSVNAKAVITLDSGIEADFASMKMNKPNPRKLRRIFQHGIWLHYKTLSHSMQFHAKINRLQIDNQLPNPSYRVMFAPVPPPPSISSDMEPKPFIEVSIMQRTNAHSYVLQYKYFKVLVQEFLVKLDIEFVNSLVDMISGNTLSRRESLMSKFDLEYAEAGITLEELHRRQIISQGQKHFYDYLHFSPLKIHVSFSMGSSTQSSNHVLNLVLASVGVTLTDIQDVVFKLACMEFQHTFLSGEQLYDEVYSHYTSQAIKQLYVLVLGLDVLGNPYGLVSGVASGVEAFFYEPIQGAIHGPGEFAEGLALGAKKLVGSTVGGAAGAFAKITGTLGKGIAALTFDDDYQRRRKDNINHYGDASEKMARSGKGLVLGFYEGLTGVVTQPVKGAKEGFGGFSKGVGKGIVGLFAKPASGLVDFTFGSFDAVHSVSTHANEAVMMRPPRCIPADSVLPPYVRHEAEGVYLLNSLERGRFMKTDSYKAHALINPHGIYTLLLTDKRLFYLKKDELFATWSIEWEHLWEDFSSPPDLVERGLQLHLKPDETKKFKLFKSSARKDLIVPIHSPEVCTWILSKIEEAMKHETGMIFSDGMEAIDYHLP